jgi:hypothetical protein
MKLTFSRYSDDEYLLWSSEAASYLSKHYEFLIMSVHQRPVGAPKKGENPAPKSEGLFDHGLIGNPPYTVASRDVLYLQLHARDAYLKVCGSQSDVEAAALHVVVIDAGTGALIYDSMSDPSLAPNEEPQVLSLSDCSERKNASHCLTASSSGVFPRHASVESIVSLDLSMRRMTVTDGSAYGCAFAVYSSVAPPRPNVYTGSSATSAGTVVTQANVDMGEPGASASHEHAPWLVDPVAWGDGGGRVGGGPEHLRRVRRRARKEATRLRAAAGGERSSAEEFAGRYVIFLFVSHVTPYSNNFTCILPQCARC